MTPTPDFADLTPPDELVQKWRYEWLHLSDTKVSPYQYITSQAARWGAQQGYQRGTEIRAGNDVSMVVQPSTAGFQLIIRAARRPAPPSIKQQALTELQQLQDDINTHGLGLCITHGAIAKALALIPEDATDG